MEQSSDSAMQNKQPSQMKFVIGGLLIVSALVYLIFTSTKTTAQYFMTVAELNEKEESIAGRNLRVSGAVLGETIQYDAQTLTLVFEMAHVSGDNKEIEREGGLAAALNSAVNDPNRPRLRVLYKGVKPDLLRHEAQAIVTGTIGKDGIFYAEELLLKCPTRYEEALPGQVDA